MSEQMPQGRPTPPTYTPNLQKPAAAAHYQQQPPPAYQPQAPLPYGYQAAAYPGMPYAGPVGKIRGTGLCILLTIVTFGVYSLYWYYATHEEMKRHSGQGLGGGLALVIAFFIGIVSPYISSNEVGDLYERAGQRRPVSALTGLWYFPGIFLFFIGPLVWFIKTNGALNAYWRARGAV